MEILALSTAIFVGLGACVALIPLVAIGLWAYNFVMRSYVRADDFKIIRIVYTEGAFIIWAVTFVANIALICIAEILETNFIVPLYVFALPALPFLLRFIVDVTRNLQLNKKGEAERIDNLERQLNELRKL